MTRSSYWDEFHNEPEDDHLEHHGVLGMKWGHRKQRIAAQRTTFFRAAAKAGNEYKGYKNDYSMAVQNKDRRAQRQLKKKMKDAKLETRNFVRQYAGVRGYTRGDVKYAQKYIDGTKSLTQVRKRDKRRTALGLSILAAAGVYAALPTIAGHAANGAMKAYNKYNQGGKFRNNVNYAMRKVFDKSHKYMNTTMASNAGRAATNVVRQLAGGRRLIGR